MVTAKESKSAKSIQPEQVKSGVDALTQLAKKRKAGYSLYDAIATMLPTIEKSFAAGYTHQDICDTLKENAGIDISPSTLKLYVNRARKTKELRGSPSRRKTSSAIAPTHSSVSD